jgi:deoxyribodipyrimidine photolyase-related protein
VLEATRPLPEFFWTGETGMNCLRQCITATRQHAYAHHIQRLMVIGNFALLAGLDPKAVNAWYLIVYADAYEWVELPNVTGMALFADGGVLASKPYAASGSYISKMSNYCASCRYDVTARTGPRACPFNYLYWNFFITHRSRLNGNMRLAMIYKTLEKMAPEMQAQIRADSQKFLDEIQSHVGAWS